MNPQRATRCFTNITLLRLLPLWLGLLGLSAVQAEDAYYHFPLSALTVTEGQWPTNSAPRVWRPWREVSDKSYVVLDGKGEAYLSDKAGTEQNSAAWEEESPAIAGMNLTNRMLSLHVPENHEITGHLYLENSDQNGMTKLGFKFTPVQTNLEARASFLQAKKSYYAGLLNQSLPGAAWFRHQMRAAATELGQQSEPDNARMNWNRRHQADWEDTFELFSGGRALSENLQLDRAMAIRQGTNAPEVALTNLTGITVQPMDWKPLLTASNIVLDPLARCIPGDQHALFFPSFQALIDLTTEADANGTPVLQLFETRAEDAGTCHRYQQQLCLNFSEASRLLGPQVIASAAFTGSDPSLRVGADVAILFEARNPFLLQASVVAQQGAAKAGHPEVQSIQGEFEGIHYTGVVSPDRSICSYQAAVSNVVFVANSRQQLEILIRTALGKNPTLEAQDEYRYFRSRYQRNATNETGFLVLSDATIRRWCGPQWRIADSRRTRSAAVLADLQASQLDQIVQGKTGGTVPAPTYGDLDLGKLELTKAGVYSATYGSLNFMTPVVELPLATVTAQEADAYRRWRDSYQHNWSQFFDPIAIRFSVSPAHVTTEVTVMPLILASRYHEFTTVGSGAKIAPDAGDPHSGALARLAVAINSQSQPVQEAGNFVGNMAPGLKANFLSWLGQSICLYADEDPFWQEWSTATNHDTFLEKNFARLPVGLHFEVKSGLGAAAFLTAVHAFVDQSAPQMTLWQNLEYQGRPYVKIAPAKGTAQNERDDNWVVYYALTPDSLTVTLSEDLLKRALDRQLSRSSTNAPATTFHSPWLGESLGLQFQNQSIDFLLKMLANEQQNQWQQLAWNNLPILNEWKRRYPDRDPVKMHEQVWGTKLLSPGGGAYVWNAAWQTMESTDFGHPGQPRTQPVQETFLRGITGINLGVTFENQGLSAKGTVDRTAASPARPSK